MPDMEKVLKGLEHCIARYIDGLCDGCPYMGELDKSYMIPMKCKEIIMRDALALLKEQQPKWIPVEERLPEENKDVLVWVNGTYRDMAYRDEGRWYDETHNILRQITHWMPLPEPPEGR